jgi:hypothetical protein
MPRLSARLIFGFALRFALVYAVLVLAWPVVRPAYGAFYRALGNIVFQGGAGEVRFGRKPEVDPEEGFDVEVVMTKRGVRGVKNVMSSSSRLIGCLPTVSLVALVLATPISWRRRRRALLWGLLLVQLFVVLRMGIPIVRDFSHPNAIQVYHPGGLGRWLLGVAERAFLRAPASWFVVPILIWILVAFRRDDRELLAAEPRDGAPNSP